MGHQKQEQIFIIRIMINHNITDIKINRILWVNMLELKMMIFQNTVQNHNNNLAKS